MNPYTEDNLVQMTECARLESIRSSSQCRADQGRALGGHRMNHEQSKRAILIAGIGTSPAVLTETVWSLAHQKKPVVPDVILSKDK